MTAGWLFHWLTRRCPEPPLVVKVPEPPVDPIEELARILGEPPAEPRHEPDPKNKPPPLPRSVRRRPGRRWSR